jgi:hypothetical protein
MNDYYDISIRIGRPGETKTSAPVSIGLPDGKSAKTRFTLPEILKGKSSNEIQDLLKMDSYTLAMELIESLFTEKILSLINAGIAEASTSITRGRILLNLSFPGFYHLPWECILQHYLFSNSLIPFSLIRCTPFPAKLSFVPFKLPISVLFIEIAGYKEDIQFPDYVKESFKYFHSTISMGAKPGDFLNFLKIGHFDIVHLKSHVNWKYNKGVFIDESSGETLDTSVLKGLIRKNRTRLLIIETNNTNYLSFLNLGHQILGRNGPVVLVVSSLPGLNSNFNYPFEQFYYDIIHDKPLDDAFINSIFFENISAAFMQAKDGENLLRLSPLKPQLFARGEIHLQEAKQAVTFLNTLKNLSIESKVNKDIVEEFDIRHKLLEDKIPKLESALSRALDFRHERGGMEPLTHTTYLLKETNREIEKANPYIRRVINTWFESGTRALEKCESLEKGRSYYLRLYIGTPSKKSNVMEPVIIPEKELWHFYSDKGLQLQVVLFSSDFKIIESIKKLKLPEPPQETLILKFKVIAPQKIGRAKIRVCIYFKQNLLQSLIVTAAISKKPRKLLTLGNQANIEFTLSQSLTDIHRFKERTLNLLTNENDNGTHTFNVYGSGIKTQFFLTEGEMRSAINNARQELQKICSTFNKKGKIKKYRFPRDNKGNEKEFIEDIKNLAFVGHILFHNIITQKDETFKSSLRQALAQPAAIQISVTKSAKYVFPWALVYDKKLLVQDDNEVCPVFLEHLREGGDPGFLKDNMCSDIPCPHQDNMNIICPWGFWGFKHIIEQPLSTYKKKAKDKDENQDQKVDLEMNIKVHDRISLLMAVSENLNDLVTHKKEIEGIKGVVSTVCSLLEKIQKELKRSDLHIIYFYCHGGRSASLMWLGVGKNQKLYPTHLSNLEVLWQDTHPLVFINGCETVSYTPDDLLTFNRTLAYCKAAGVIGTEIVIPEILARHFAKGFFKDFFLGEKLGNVIKKQRLRLLEHYNPLGLVYTPYCSADLCIQKIPG